jgi:hypothetical protein
METEMSQEIKDKYYCSYCYYITSRKNDYDKHIMTRKHKIALSGNIKETIKPANSQLYICNNCNKEYKGRAGLWKHKQKCNGTKEESEYSEKG